MIYTNGQGKEYYYFTAHKDCFSFGTQICSVEGGAIEKTAKLWAKCNVYEKVFVYDLWHKFVGEF